jgi:hypothetical protein
MLTAEFGDAFQRLQHAGRCLGVNQGQYLGSMVFQPLPDCF